MALLRIIKFQILLSLQLLFFLQIKLILCYQYKVGDLDSWGIPTSANPHVYSYWSKKHKFQLGDSLLFLYPPSQDSVIQVTDQSFKNCNLKDPILYMGDGNSVFNITSPGEFFFTSGVSGHCQKGQKLQISVLSANGSQAFSPSYAPTALADTAPSYPTVFGSIPASNSSSSSSSYLRSSSAILASLVGITVYTLACGSIWKV